MSARLTAAALLGAAAAAAALGHSRGLRSGMAIGYAYGRTEWLRSPLGRSWGPRHD